MIRCCFEILRDKAKTVKLRSLEEKLKLIFERNTRKHNTKS